MPRWDQNLELHNCQTITANENVMLQWYITLKSEKLQTGSKYLNIFSKKKKTKFWELEKESWRIQDGIYFYFKFLSHFTS